MYYIKRMEQKIAEAITLEEALTHFLKLVESVCTQRVLADIHRKTDDPSLLGILSIYRAKQTISDKFGGK